MVPLFYFVGIQQGKSEVSRNFIHFRKERENISTQHIPFKGSMVGGWTWLLDLLLATK